MSDIEKQNTGDICLADSATTHTILRNQKYFLNLTLLKANVNTISGPADLIEGSGRAMIFLPNNTKICINDTLYSSKSKRNLLSFKDIRCNGYHIETINDENIEYLCITSHNSGRKLIMEKLRALSSGLYYTLIRDIDVHAVMNQKFSDPKIFMLWHDRLGHPGSTMMRKIIENSHGHPLKNQKILLSYENLCTACSQGKLVIKPSHSKVDFESPSFLQRIQGDICGHIHPPSGPFRYFMVLVDASITWSHICLLSTRNVAFARLLAQIIRLQAHFPDHLIKSIRLDNADCHFDEKNFPSLGKGKTSPEEKREFSWKVPSLIHLDPYTSQCENEVRKIVHLQTIANQLPDAFTDVFTDATRVTKSHIPAVNVPARVIVPGEQSKQIITKESSTVRQKRGRPLGSKDTVPRRKKTKYLDHTPEIINKSTFFKLTPQELDVLERTQETPVGEGISEEIQEPRNEEISINYTGGMWNRKETIIDDIFSYTVATEILNDDCEPYNLDDCRQRSD
ncbi:hypothetical protein Q3G72_010194 [Acer saccharum]|nr:hypothetical protein Q3G72_010194 [Acer saccharum]